MLHFRDICGWYLSHAYDDIDSIFFGGNLPGVKIVGKGAGTKYIYSP